MAEKDGRDALPREWLPRPSAPHGAAEWQAMRERIMTQAEPTLQTLREGGAASVMLEFGSWWRPAAVLAAAAALVLVIADTQDAARTERSALPLNVIAANGEPFALWQGVGRDADPVLALIVSQTAQ